MKHTRKLLLASTACAVLALGFSSDASAFDDVNWTWNKTVTENVLKDVDYDLVTTPTGMVEVEKIQMNIGDVNASSVVSGIDNNPPGIGEGGTVTVNETITVTSNFDKPVGVGNSVGNSGGGVNDDGDSPLTSTYLGGTLSEQANGFTVINDLAMTGEFELEDLEGVNDAIDLPKIESTATAVANNQSIDSSVSVQLHDAQYNWGGFGDIAGSDSQIGLQDQGQLLSSSFGATGNTHTNILLSAALSGALGIIEPGSVTATSSVSEIQNASIDSDATAVANNLSIDLDATTQDDAFMIADLTQFNYADVSADSSVNGISIDNYANLGGAGFGPGSDQIALVSSAATAVGNNVSISVSSPVGDLAP